MPIRPENKKLYPKNWKEIRERIKTRAGNKCEICGVENYAIGFRDKGGTFHKVSDQGWYRIKSAYFKKIKIICTTMHLDHNPQNNADNNLKFGCQKCHNNHDKEHRAKNRKLNKLRAEQDNSLSLQLDQKTEASNK